MDNDRHHLHSVLNYAISRGYQVHPDALKILERIDSRELERIIKQVIRSKSSSEMSLIVGRDLEPFVETYLPEAEQQFGLAQTTTESSHKIVFDPTDRITSSEGIEGFASLFGSRYKKLTSIISKRPEAKKLISITAAKARNQNSNNRTEEENFLVSGLLMERKVERNITKLVLDDPTGSIESLVFDEELREIANSLFIDQMVILELVQGKNGGFIVKNIIVPDVPTDRISNKSDSDTYAVFISDIHIGSKYFMEKEFAEFVSWLSSGDPVARRVKFVLICGDVVDGVGIFPNQDAELVQINVYDQMTKLYEMLKDIPEHIKVFIAPGNHDPGRRALPQPAIPSKYNSDLWNRDNFFMIGNPAVVELNGVRVLMYHGQSLDDVVGSTPGLSYNHPAKGMRELLRSRHLSPIYGNRTPIAPEIEDMMVIEEVPDIFHAGHVHIVDVENYKGTLIINSGAWQGQTPFQASSGVQPTPGIAVIVNLSTLKVSTKDFSESQSTSNG